MNRSETLRWLREDDPAALDALWARADAVRRERVGDAVHLRGLVEISNHCVRRCAYCGISADNRTLARYRMTADEIAESGREAVALRYGSIVLQAGEDDGIARDWLAAVVRRLKVETPLAVTLSLGERPDDDLAAWRAAGADRYLLRFETSDAALYDRIHPPHAGRRSDRFAILRRLRALGYEVGSGVMLGIPGQTYVSLADDIAAFAAFDLDMVGVGPFIPHPATPLGRGEFPPAPTAEQVPATKLMTGKVIALARLACPDANIPATTALAALDPAAGHAFALARGANVVMPDLTPARYRAMYEIYPGKSTPSKAAIVCGASPGGLLAAIGRLPGTGTGGRRHTP